LHESSSIVGVENSIIDDLFWKMGRLKLERLEEDSSRVAKWDWKRD